MCPGVGLKMMTGSISEIGVMNCHYINYHIAALLVAYLFSSVSAMVQTLPGGSWLGNIKAW